MSSADPYSRVEYRRLIAWPRRIRREWPLLDRALSSGPSRRVLDLGCGTGEHARFLAAQEFEVVAVDASPSMLEKAREEPAADLPPGPPGGATENLRFIAGDLAALDALVDGRFGGAVCLGNTLPHLVSREALDGFFHGLRRRLDPGAAVLLQLLNYERIFARGERYLPLNFRPDDDGEIVFLRLMEARKDGGVLFFPTTLKFEPDRDPPVSVVTSRRVELRGWRPGEIETALETAGFGQRELFGAFDEGAFEPMESRDLIVVAR